MKLNGLGELLADREDRIKRGHRFLKDHRDLVAADVANLFVVELDEVVAVEDDLTRYDAAGRDRKQAQDAEGADAFAAAALADNREGLTLVDVVGDTVYGLYYTFLGVEVDPEIFDLKKWRHQPP